MRNEEKTYRIFFIIRGYKIYKIGLAPNPPYRKNNFRLCYKEFEIDPKVFDPEDDDAYHKLAMQFFSEITSQALAASKPETGAEELENTRSQLTEWIDHVKDAPHQEPVKNYFQFLLAYVNKDDYQTLLQNIDPELKTIFENCLNHD